MYFDVSGGHQVAAYTDQDLVEALRAKLLPSVNTERFMDVMAQLCRTQNSVEVRTNSTLNFLHDLQEHGIIAAQNAWSMIGLDAVQIGFISPNMLTCWTNKLLWSSEYPLVIATNSAGGRVASLIDISLLPVDGYLAQFTRNHIKAISQQH
jgi:hypothetical protein